jgi:hypothetical protein
LQTISITGKIRASLIQLGEDAMNDAVGSGMKEKNIGRLREIAGLVPIHGITVEAFEYIYPGE